MLRPSKHTSLKYSIVNMSAQILKITSESGIIPYNELLQNLRLTIGEKAGENFVLSLSFLYIHGKIEYIRELDAIRAL